MAQDGLAWALRARVTRHCGHLPTFWRATHRIVTEFIEFSNVGRSRTGLCLCGTSQFVYRLRKPGPRTEMVRGPGAETRCQAQEDPTALSVVDMLLPAAWTFCPWALAC